MDPLNSRIRATAVRDLPAPPEEAFRALLRADRYGDWWPTKVRWIAPGGPLHLKAKLELQAIGTRGLLEVVRIEEGKCIWMRFTGGPYVGTGEWLVEPAEGGCRVAFRLRAEPVGLWANLLWRLIDLGRLYSVWAEDALQALEKRLAAAS